MFKTHSPAARSSPFLLVSERAFLHFLCPCELSFPANSLKIHIERDKPCLAALLYSRNGFPRPSSPPPRPLSAWKGVPLKTRPSPRSAAPFYIRPSHAQTPPASRPPLPPYNFSFVSLPPAPVSRLVSLPSPSQEALFSYPFSNGTRFPGNTSRSVNSFFFMEAYPHRCPDKLSLSPLPPPCRSNRFRKGEHRQSLPELFQYVSKHFFFFSEPPQSNHRIVFPPAEVREFQSPQASILLVSLFPSATSLLWFVFSFYFENLPVSEGRRSRLSPFKPIFLPARDLSLDPFPAVEAATVCCTRRNTFSAYLPFS